jgi:hypothetical protein
MLPNHALPRADINRTLGLAGSVAVALGGVAAGALPAHDPFGGWPVIRELRAIPLAGTTLTFLGLTLLTGAWLRLRTTTGRTRDMIVTFVWWAVPLVLAPPLYSRDVYSYVAQGAMVKHSIDAYANGPSALGGVLAANVPDIWQHTPAPYGPVFLRLASAVVWITGDHTVAAALGMRLLALVGVGLIVGCLPALAARCGIRPASALWLAVLNPLVLMHLVAGAHNDALMVGLMTAGLLAALRGRHLVAIALICAAALIKAPALVALICTVQPLALRLSGRWRLPRAAALTTGAAAAVLALLTIAMRLGSGWVGALNTPATVRNGLSLSTDVGMGVGRLGELLGVTTMPATVAAFRTVGWVIGIGLAGLALLWTRQGVRALGLALTAIVLCGPIVHPWYVLWGLVPLAAGAADDPRVRRPVIVLTVGLSFFLMPYGGGPTPSAVVAGLVGLGAGMSYLLLHRTISEAREEFVSLAHVLPRGARRNAGARPGRLLSGGLGSGGIGSGRLGSGGFLARSASGPLRSGRLTPVWLRPSRLGQLPPAWLRPPRWLRPDRFASDWLRPGRRASGRFRPAVPGRDPLGRDGLGREAAGHVAEREVVSVDAEAADHAGRDGGDDRMVPEVLARVDVGDVHLDERPAQHRTRVAQRDRVVRPRRRVEHNGGALVGGGVEPAEHRGLVVGLSHLDRQPQLRAGAHTAGGEVGVAGEAVDVGLAGAESTQVGAVEHVDLHEPTSS